MHAAAVSLKCHRFLNWLTATSCQSLTEKCIQNALTSQLSMCHSNVNTRRFRYDYTCLIFIAREIQSDVNKVALSYFSSRINSVAFTKVGIVSFPCPEHHSRLSVCFSLPIVRFLWRSGRKRIARMWRTYMHRRFRRKTWRLLVKVWRRQQANSTLPKQGNSRAFRRR